MICPPPASPTLPDLRVREFYVDAMRTLDRAGVPYVVGGGYAMAHYTGIPRQTKDLDIYVRPRDSQRALDVLSAAGYRTEYFYPFWIAKALPPDGGDDVFMDILYNSGNGVCQVDEQWFERSIPGEAHGHPVRLVAVEETIWCKSFVQDRDRFDGSDIAHLILCRGSKIDWDHLVRRFAGGHESVLLAHLILFRYIYPTERGCVSDELIDRLISITRAEPKSKTKLCRGTNLANRAYGMDIRRWGFTDARLQPHGSLTPDQIAQMPEPECR
jgi:hypothetical protein